MVADSAAAITTVISTLLAITGGEDAGTRLAFLAATTIVTCHRAAAAVIMRPASDSELLAAVRSALTLACDACRVRILITDAAAAVTTVITALLVITGSEDAGT